MRNEKIESGNRAGRRGGGGKGSMRNGRPSLVSSGEAFAAVTARVRMNGRYYFIGDQAKSKIEKRTDRDERK